MFVSYHVICRWFPNVVMLTRNEIRKMQVPTFSAPTFQQNFRKKSSYFTNLHILDLSLIFMAISANLSDGPSKSYEKVMMSPNQPTNVWQLSQWVNNPTGGAFDPSPAIERGDCEKTDKEKWLLILFSVTSRKEKPLQRGPKISCCYFLSNIHKEGNSEQAGILFPSKQISCSDRPLGQRNCYWKESKFIDFFI